MGLRKLCELPTKRMNLPELREPMEDASQLGHPSTTVTNAAIRLMWIAIRVLRVIQKRRNVTKMNWTHLSRMLPLKRKLKRFHWMQIHRNQRINRPSESAAVGLLLITLAIFNYKSSQIVK